MKFDRLIAILFVLLNRDDVTAKELAEKFEVSTRTIYRDLDTLLYSGFPIVTKQGNQGGVKIDKDYKLDKQFFSSNELSSLLIGLSGISSIIPDHSVTAAYEKVKSLMPDTTDDGFTDQFEQVFIDLMKWQEYGDSKDKLKSIRKGMQESYLIEFRYFDKKGNETLRVVEPYRLMLKEMKWYLEAYCTDREDYRMFKLTRMSSVNLLNTKFNKRNFVPIEHDREGWIKEHLFNIEIEFNKNIYESISEKCGEGNIERLDENKFKATMPFTDDEYSYNSLLGYGSNVKCLSPKFVVEKLKATAQGVVDLYK